MGCMWLPSPFLQFTESVKNIQSTLGGNYQIMMVPILNEKYIKIGVLISDGFNALIKFYSSQPLPLTENLLWWCYYVTAQCSAVVATMVLGLGKVARLRQINFMRSDSIKNNYFDLLQHKEILSLFLKYMLNISRPILGISDWNFLATLFSTYSPWRMAEGRAQ